MGGVENPDTSLVRRLKHSCQYRNTKSKLAKKEPLNQDQQNRKRTEQTQNKRGGGSVEKPDTSLARQFKHLNKKQEEQITKQETKQDSTNEAAPKAVRELSAIRGGKSGTRKAGSPDSLQSENPGTREKKESEREKEGAEHKDESKNKRERRESKSKRGGVERGAGSPGTSLARKTRSQRERRKRSRVRGNYATRGNIVE